MNALSYTWLGVCVLGACDGAPAPEQSDGTIAVRVGTDLAHDVLTKAHYRVSVFDGDGTLVDQQLVSPRVDDLAEVSLRCNLAAPETRVHIALESLSDAFGTFARDRDFVAVQPVVSHVVCRERGLVATTVPVTRPSLRDEARARRCTGLLQRRDEMAVVRFMCVDRERRPLALWMDHVSIRCNDGTTVDVEPGPPTSSRGSPDADASGRDVSQWNTVIDLGDVDIVGRDGCWLHAKASASDPSRTDLGPRRSRWPAIVWDAPLTKNNGIVIDGDIALEDDSGFVDERFIYPDYRFDARYDNTTDAVTMDLEPR